MRILPDKISSQLPNLLTVGRLAVIPILIPLYLIDFSWLNIFCAILFAIAAATDYFDGYLARKFNLVSPFGAALDQIADKLLVTTGLILLVGSNVLPELMAILIILRELFVLAMRLMAAEHGITINVNSFGKAKTFAQDVGIVCLFINNALFAPTVRQAGMLSLWIAIVLGLYSAYTYWAIFWPNIKTHFNNEQK
jgi:CDP-diacylglycerol---glycerol-3-phosphate 3-phosphatidyltransferase